MLSNFFIRLLVNLNFYDNESKLKNTFKAQARRLRHNEQLRVFVLSLFCFSKKVTKKGARFR
jgi:hypothetical protein